MKDLQTLEEISLPEKSPSTPPCTAHTVHMQSPQTAYTPSEVMEILGCGQRTVFKYANELIDTWHWLPETAFRRDGKYTSFALEEMRKRKACSLKTYQEETWSREGREAKAVEAEIVEPLESSALAVREYGTAITSQTITQTATAPIKLSLQPIQLTKTKTDNSELDAETEALREFTANGMKQIAEKLSDDLAEQFRGLMSTNANFAVMVQAMAVNKIAQDLSPKSDGGE